MKFSCIVADPPWSFSDELKQMRSKTRRSAASQYSLMTRSEIARLDVRSLADPLGCVLALWVPSTLLQDGLDVMRAWGFAHKQTLPWVKTKADPLRALRVDLKKRVADYVAAGRSYTEAVDDAADDFSLDSSLAFGMGRLFRQSHELALIGTSGKSPYARLRSRSQRSVVFAPNAGHSRKPEVLQDRLDAMFPAVDKLEMFARRCRPGWTCVGDALTSKDIAVSIQELSDPPPIPPWVGEECGMLGCRRAKGSHPAMCDTCYEDFKEDPEAHK